MDLIYHEKQDGLLCAQHCLNNLLQGQYFTAVDLAEIASQMDRAEQQHMAEFGRHTEDYRKFMEQPSGNMDDSGMFSVQVITSALKVWDLSLVPYDSSSPLAVTARDNPTEQLAYICNFKEHWLTVRKLGQQWFNLNSLLTFPELISHTYLALFLKQLQHEGYSIFVVDGGLPPSEADETLRLHPATQTTRPRLLTEEGDKEENELKAALAASLARVGGGQASTEGGDDDLERALQLSLSSGGGGEEPGEEEQLQQALRMSMEQPGGSQQPEPTIEELRAKRLAFLEKNKH